MNTHLPKPALHVTPGQTDPAARRPSRPSGVRRTAPPDFRLPEPQAELIAINVPRRTGRVVAEEGVVISTDLRPDPPVAHALNRVGRMVTDLPSSLGGTIALMLGEFQCATRCRVYLVPDPSQAEPVTRTTLGHRITVVRTMHEGHPTWRVDETRNAINLRPEVSDPIFAAMAAGKPCIYDHRGGLYVVFQNLDMDNDDAHVWSLPTRASGDMIALLPFCYRDTKPFGIMILDGDLQCRDSALTGFPRVYWSAKLATELAAQVTSQLVHTYDALTQFPRLVDFNIDFRNSVRDLLSQNSTEELYLLFIDLDDFGKVNKIHNQSTGNILLSAVADAIRGVVRMTDRVGRVGGEEICVLLRKVTSQDAALDVAERIRKAVASVSVPSLSRKHAVAGTNVQVTCSIGVANVGRILTEQAISTADLEQRVSFILELAIKLANEQMQIAKARGKNQVRYLSSV